MNNNTGFVCFMRNYRQLIIPLITGLVLILGGCGDDNNDPISAGDTPQDVLDRGWIEFEAGNYNAALTDFQTAFERDGTLADALNGSGWASGRMEGNLNEAEDYFSGCLAQDTTMYDALGGWVFIAFQQGNWEGTISKADSLLHRRPGWRFLHEPTIDFYDIYLVIATSYCKFGDYQSALNIVVTYLNPEFEADIVSALGQRELLDEIERLSRIYG